METSQVVIEGGNHGHVYMKLTLKQSSNKSYVMSTVDW